MTTPSTQPPSTPYQFIFHTTLTTYKFHSNPLLSHHLKPLATPVDKAEYTRYRTDTTALKALSASLSETCDRNRTLPAAPMLDLWVQETEKARNRTMRWCKEAVYVRRILEGRSEKRGEGWVVRSGGGSAGLVVVLRRV